MTATVPAPVPAARKRAFISYSRADLVRVRSLAAALRRHGVDTWLDLEDLRPGQKWKDAIGSALAAADAMVFCLSTLSLQSAWTGVELRRAARLGLPIVPVAVEPVAMALLPLALRGLHVYDMARHPARQAATRTAHDIAAALGVMMSSAAVQRAGEPDGGAGAADAADEADSAVDTFVVVIDPIDWSKSDIDALLPGASRVERLLISSAERLQLSDLLGASGRARRAVLLLGAESDAVLAGVVLGALAGGFGSGRISLWVCGEPTKPLAAAAQFAGVQPKVLAPR